MDRYAAGRLRQLVLVDHVGEVAPGGRPEAIAKQPVARVGVGVHQLLAGRLVEHSLAHSAFDRAEFHAHQLVFDHHRRLRRRRRSRRQDEPARQQVVLHVRSFRLVAFDHQDFVGNEVAAAKELQLDGVGRLTHGHLDDPQPLVELLGEVAGPLGGLDALAVLVAMDFDCLQRMPRVRADKGANQAIDRQRGAASERRMPMPCSNPRYPRPIFRLSPPWFQQKMPSVR